MYILALLLIFILFILFMPLLGLSQILSRLFFGKRRGDTFGQRQQSAYTKPDEQGYSQPQKGKKVFDKSEGEYIDFEEIKE